MPITPGFIKALKFLLAAIAILYLVNLGQQFSGTHGYSLSHENSFFRKLINQLVSFAEILAFWYAVYIVTKDKIAVLIAIILKTLFLVFMQFKISSYTNEQEVMNSFLYIGIGMNVLVYTLFGLLHFKGSKGLYMLFGWLILFGITNGPGFNASYSFFNRMLGILDLDDLLTFQIPLGEGRERHVELLRGLFSEAYLPFQFIIFWFVYSLIKTGKRFDLTLKTFQLNQAMNQLTFSMVYWPMRMILFVAAFGITGLVANSLQRDFSYLTIVKIAISCFSVFVVGSLYRNTLTEYLFSRGRAPGWLYLFLNIPIVGFIAWIYTFYLPVQTQTDDQSGDVVNDQDYLIPANEAQTDEVSSADGDNSEQPKADQQIQKSSPIWSLYWMQQDYAATGRNGVIKVLMIFTSLGLLLWQFRDSGSRMSSGQMDSPVLVVVTMISLMIWYLYDKKAFIPLFILQTISILTIALLRLPIDSIALLGNGMVNIVVYYALFHFDHLRVINGSPGNVEPN